MKRFQFSLDTVLDYKTQVLENLRTEQAMINNAVQNQEEQVGRVRQTLSGYQTEFDEAKVSGCVIENFLLYDMCIGNTEKVLKEEKKRLVELEKKAEQKKWEVVEAKTDTSKFEKLKKRRLDAYNKEAAKAEEQFVEEFVLRGRVRNRS